jgi:Predicted periplasmic protein
MFGMRDFGTYAQSLRKQRIAAVVALFLVLVLPRPDLRAELLFRSVEQANGHQGPSPIRKYSNPSDIAYPRFSFGTAAPAEEVRVFLTGEISRADMDSAEILVRLVQSGKQKIAGNTVWLASSGGDIDTAMDLGRLLRKWGIFTYVAKNDQCFSACVFAFMGGERRGVAGRLGIHRPYFLYTQDSPDRQARFRNLQKVVKGYVEEMDFPDSLYEAIMLVPPQSMQIVAPADLKRFYLEGISPSSEDIADAASARRLNLPMVEYLQLKAKAPACTFPVAIQGRCESPAHAETASGGVPEKTLATGMGSTGDAINTQRTGNPGVNPRRALGSY